MYTCIATLSPLYLSFYSRGEKNFIFRRGLNTRLISRELRVSELQCQIKDDRIGSLPVILIEIIDRGAFVD